MSTKNHVPRLLILGAHPDDAEYHAGGLAVKYRRLERPVKMISVTDGGAGHYAMTAQQLAPLRRQEAAAAGRVIGATYDTWDFPDGQLVPSLEVRARIVREIRTFQPDLVLTHRTCDYHPDHRAVGQAVQDASYMVTVPGYLPQVRALRRDPVVAYLPDLFTKPYPLATDVVLDVTDCVDSIVQMLACQRSQVFDWLPFEEGILDQVPAEDDQRLVWLRAWYARHVGRRVQHFRPALVAQYGTERGRRIEFAEFFEISEYARQPAPGELQTLFPESTE